MSVIKELAESLDKKIEEVSNFLMSAPKKYKVYTIPKRTLGRRVIAQPSRELKIYQKKYIELHPFPAHAVAMAYCKKLSIKDNAQAHKNNTFLLKMDLENFFNSITPAIFWTEWQGFYTEPTLADKLILERLFFWSPNKRLDSGSKLILSIGAPSSPSLSNFIMYRFDEMTLLKCTEMNISYTRYADDLTFSSNKKNILFEIPKIIQQHLISIFNGKLRINKNKTFFSSKGHNRHVTGITLTNQNTLSLGRDKKRYLKSLVHQFTLGRFDADQLYHLQGWLAFAKHVDPIFIASLNKKYTSEIILAITKAQK